MENPISDGRQFRTAFVLLLVVSISALFLAVSWPLLPPLVLAAVLSVLCRPTYRWLLRVCKGRESLASALTLLILFLLIVGPISAFISVVVKQAILISNDALPWVQKQLQAGSGGGAHDWLVTRLPSLANVIPEQAVLAEHVGNTAKTVGAALVGGVSLMTAGTATLLLNFFVMLYAMFFFLKNGKAILEQIFYYMPLGNEDEARMLERFTSVTRATVKGTLVIGFIQGSLAGIGFALAGIGGAAFWGTAMFILSVIPGIGATLIWLPAVIYLFATGQTMAATLLGLWCAAIVGTIDNILRPTLVGKDAQMPDLLILIGTLGGLFLFGPIGFITGPIVCGLFLTVWDIYGMTFQSILPPVQILTAPQVVDHPPVTVEKPTRTRKKRTAKPES